jgi:hypothetical protein
VAELVDAHDSKSCAERRAGSIPASGTNPTRQSGFFFYSIASSNYTSLSFIIPYGHEVSVIGITMSSGITLSLGCIVHSEWTRLHSQDSVTGLYLYPENDLTDTGVCGGIGPARLQADVDDVTAALLLHIGIHGLCYGKWPREIYFDYVTSLLVA